MQWYSEMPMPTTTPAEVILRTIIVREPFRRLSAILLRPCCGRFSFLAGGWAACSQRSGDDELAERLKTFIMHLRGKDPQFATQDAMDEALEQGLFSTAAKVRTATRLIPGYLVHTYIAAKRLQPRIRIGLVFRVALS